MGISPAIGKIGKDASIRRQLDSGKLARRTGSRNASHREKSALKLTASQPNWNSANANTVNVKAGERQAELPNSEVSDTGLEGAATKGSGVREEGGADLSKVGREGKDNLDGLPKDAT